MNKLFLLIVNLSLLLVLCASTRADVRYQLTNLGVLQGGTDSYAKAINNHGQIVGASMTSGGFYHAFLYTDSAMTDLGTLNDDTSSAATSINDNGQIIGESYPSNGVYYHAFSYSGSTKIDLGNPVSDSQIYASHINNSGQIVGGVISGIFSNHSYSQALLYTELTWNIIGPNLGASAINDNGQIVGSSFFDMPKSVSNAFFYDGSTWTKLGTLPGFDGSGASDINNQGQISGSATKLLDTGTGCRAILYSGSSIIDLGILPGFTDSKATAINNVGEVVGNSFNLSIANSSQRAFLYSGSATTDINTLLDASVVGWTIISASDINDSGQIVGSAVGPSGESHAILLTPVPEPSTLFLISLG